MRFELQYCILHYATMKDVLINSMILISIKKYDSKYLIIVNINNKLLTKIMFVYIYFIYLKLTDMSIFRRFSNVGNCGISFCTTLLNASNIE